MADKTPTPACSGLCCTCTKPARHAGACQGPTPADDRVAALEARVAALELKLSSKGTTQ